jgi:hypothetical protein
MLACLPITSSAQPVALTPPQLDQLVARIALYPDPVLAQTLTASTYWSVIPEAAAWADQHSYLKGDALAQAMQADHLQWDPSILALLPFPSVLDMMARDLAWTQQLGNAVLTQNSDVMDAVQRMRQRAHSYGYRRGGGDAWCPSEEIATTGPFRTHQGLQNWQVMEIPGQRFVGRCGRSRGAFE